MKFFVLLFLLSDFAVARSSLSSSRGGSAARTAVSTRNQQRNLPTAPRQPVRPTTPQVVYIQQKNSGKGSASNVGAFAGGAFLGSRLGSVGNRKTTTRRTTTTSTTTTSSPTTTLYRDCIYQIDAFAEGLNSSYVFQSNRVFEVKWNQNYLKFTVKPSVNISFVFPGIQVVTAAVYHPMKERMILFDGRQVTTFTFLNEWSILNSSKVNGFQPKGAIFYDGEIVLISDSGQYVIFDEEYNTIRQMSPLKGFPSSVRGLSNRFIYTPIRVYRIKQEMNGLEEMTIDEHFGTCSSVTY